MVLRKRYFEHFLRQNTLKIPQESYNLLITNTFL
uniref:Uncharacterized protein n=1 Tax=Siphoviridae sp. ctDOT22 TaxID=2827812 RepID=A0A8S5SVX4_9CAUD|nr:MAG TPA: hypothetical protein [Siphoviridae sp. ctDOT22]